MTNLEARASAPSDVGVTPERVRNGGHNPQYVVNSRSRPLSDTGLAEKSMISEYGDRQRSQLQVLGRALGLVVHDSHSAHERGLSQ